MRTNSYYSIAMHSCRYKTLQHALSAYSNPPDVRWTDSIADYVVESIQASWGANPIAGPNVLRGSRFSVSDRGATSHPTEEEATIEKTAVLNAVLLHGDSQPPCTYLIDAERSEVSECHGLRTKREQIFKGVTEYVRLTLILTGRSSPTSMNKLCDAVLTEFPFFEEVTPRSSSGRHWSVPLFSPAKSIRTAYLGRTESR